MLNSSIHQTNDSQKNLTLMALQRNIQSAWKKLNLCWPIENIIASNPLYGLEEIPFEESINLGTVYYRHESLPEEMREINRESIKWCMVYFDEGQASIPMPGKENGLYQAWKNLAVYEAPLLDATKVNQIKSLPDDPVDVILYTLKRLDIHREHWELFITLTLSTLPGWSGYIKTRSDWPNNNPSPLFTISTIDYLAFRMALICINWPNAKDLIHWHQQQKYSQSTSASLLHEIQANEQSYKANLLQHLNDSINNRPKLPHKIDAQFVFCIDVRSEPIRRAIESLGAYQTFGFAGFFGMPLRIHHDDKKISACPALLEPHINVTIKQPKHIKRSLYRQFTTALSNAYHQLKFTYTTPFILAEVLGPWLGLYMFIKGFMPLIPKYLLRIATAFNRQHAHPAIEIEMDSADQRENECRAALSFLRAIDLTKSFAKSIVLCGHRAETTNNAYASALDCGACGGHPGGINAFTLVTILNKPAIRDYLSTQNIHIPAETQFYAAEHNTTTDEVAFIPYKKNEINAACLEHIRNDLNSARLIANKERIIQLAPGYQPTNESSIAKKLVYRSNDWSQPRPEWGLAGNAAMIIGSRDLTASINLQGRAFLHSYHWEEDHDNQILHTILTAPTIVAYWINTQYLFSTIDNTNYGSGSKITQNISGKIGIIQGNASDLMHGLPWQSVYAAENMTQHTPLRLLVVVHAPRDRILNIINNDAQLLRLISNKWIRIVAIDPEEDLFFDLLPNRQWRLYLNDADDNSQEDICTKTKMS